MPTIKVLAIIKPIKKKVTSFLKAPLMVFDIVRGDALGRIKQPRHMYRPHISSSKWCQSGVQLDV